MLRWKYISQRNSATFALLRSAEAGRQNSDTLVCERARRTAAAFADPEFYTSPAIFALIPE